MKLRFLYIFLALISLGTQCNRKFVKVAEGQIIEVSNDPIIVENDTISFDLVLKVNKSSIKNYDSIGYVIFVNDGLIEIVDGFNLYQSDFNENTFQIKRTIHELTHMTEPKGSLMIASILYRRNMVIESPDLEIASIVKK